LNGAADCIPHIVRLGFSVPTVQSCQMQVPVRHSASVWQSCADPCVDDADVATGVHWFFVEATS
jgi:hypothetical protein